MKKVLIVEDDPMLSEIYQKKFEKNGNFEVIKASSGTEAQEKAKKEKPDLVLLDLVLPEMDGFDVLKEIRKDPSLNNVKVVPFSNLSQEDNLKKLEELGADGFIAKSEHTPQQLIDEVERILQENEKKTISKNISNVATKSDKFSADDQKRILIIEDEEVLAEVFGKKLEEVGFEVEKETTGADGSNLMTQKNFKLVIIDITLPDFSAKQIITDFKKQFPKATTKFVVLKSEADSERESAELKKMGVQGVVDKNRIEPDRFAAGVKKMLK